MAFWSVMAMCCGLSRDAMQLAIARIGVGVGEATLGPSAYSLISDSFTRDKALRAVGLFTMGQSIGAGLAFLLGGQVVEWATTSNALVFPMVGLLEPWQATFVFFGLPGLLLVPVMYLVAEPKRTKGACSGSQNVIAADSLASFLLRERRCLLPLFLGASITTVMGYAYFWVPEMFRRIWAWEMGTIGLFYGGGLAIVGPIGVIIGSRLAERMFAAGDPLGPLKAIVYSVLVFMVFAVAAPLMPNAVLSMALFMPALLSLAMASATTSAAVMHVAPRHIRAQFSAAYLLTITLMGVSLGPTSVAFVTEHVFGDPSRLNLALAAVSGCISLAAVSLLVLARSRYRALAMYSSGASSVSV
jgi:MFS family permease